MEMGTIIIIGGITVGILSIIVYAAIAIFFPEWVGITGKVARSAEESHEEGSKITTDNFADKL